MNASIFHVGFLLCVFAISVGGCAARTSMMQSSGSIQQRIKQTPLRNNVSIKDVTSDNETNPLWASGVNSAKFKNVLEESFKAVGIYSPNSTGKYRLIVNLEEFSIGGIFDITSTSRVKYILYKHKTGKNIYSNTLETSYTVNFGDSFVSEKILRLANEGAIRMNIKRLIDDLFELNIKISIDTY